MLVLITFRRQVYAQYVLRSRCTSTPRTLRSTVVVSTGTFFYRRFHEVNPHLSRQLKTNTIFRDVLIDYYY